MKQFIILIILIALSQIIYAGDIQTITISNAIDLALKNNLDLRQAEKDVTIAQAQYGESFADFSLPGVALNGSFTLLDPLTVSNGIVNSPSGYGVKGNVVYPTGFSTISNVYPDNYSGGVTISKALFTGFKLWNLLEIKQMNLDLAKKKYDDTKSLITYNTAVSFYNIMVLRENIKLTQDLDRQLSNQLQSAIIGYNNGIVSELDRVRAEVLYENNMPFLLQATNSYIQSSIALCNLIGVKDYSTVVFLGDLMDYTNVVFTNNNETDVINMALSNSIDLLSIDYALRIIDLNKKVNEGNYYPTLSASFNFQDAYKRQFTDTNRNWWPSWTAGLQLSYALDTFIPISKTVKTSQEFDETITKNKLARQEISDGLILQVKTLLLQLDQSKQSISSQQKGLKQAQLGLKLANDQYQAGQASSLNLSDAQASYTQAMQNYLQAVYGYFSSILRLKRLIGEN